MTDTLTADEFVCGLLAGLRLRERSVVPIRGTHFDRTLAAVFDDFSALQHAAGIDLDFEILPHPVHGDSVTVRDALSVAVQGRIASLDNPKYQHLRIKIDDARANELLEALPGGRDLFLELTDDFLSKFESVAA